MLDQNTDRMWYVIGAVLIGAAIIFGFNTFMPTAFASVGGMFADTTEGISYRFFWEPRFEYGDGTENRKYESVTRRQYKVAGSYDFAPLFQAGASHNPKSSIYIMNVFDEPDAEYTFTFDGDRFGYGDVTYDFYFGETLVESVTLGGQEVFEVAMIGVSPTDLVNENYIKIRTQYDQRNNFWMSDLAIRPVG